VQITRTTRLRLMTLHLRHIFLTEAITFILLSVPRKRGKLKLSSLGED